jgi:hypothetical protein
MTGTPKSRFPYSYPLAMLCFGVMLGLAAWLGYAALQVVIRADPMYLAANALKAEATVLGLRTDEKPPNPNSKFPRADRVNYVRYSFVDEEGRTHEAEGQVSAVLFTTLKVGDTNAAYYMRGAPQSSSFGAPESIRSDVERGSLILDLLLAGGALAAALFFLNRAVFLRRGFGLL